MNKLFATKGVELPLLLDVVGEAICLCTNNMVFVASNQKLAEYYGKNAGELIGKSVFEFYPEFKSSVFYDAAKHTIITGENATRIGYSNNIKKWIVVRTFAYDENHVVWIGHELKNGLDKVCYVTHYDNLTSLQNRFRFDEDLTKIHQYRKNYGIIIIDINKFRLLNESLGFNVGDMCLMEIAARLKVAISSNSQIYRIGSDQFSILLSQDREFCLKEIDKVLSVFKKPYLINSEEFNITASLGFIYVDKFDLLVTDVLSNVEFALNKAKKFKNNYIEYNEKLIRNTSKMLLANDIKKGLLEDQFVLYYQAQIDSITGKVCGAEALIRWNHPEKGLVPPNDFLNVAEEYDLMEELDKYVLIKSLKDIFYFKEHGIELPISINFSSKTICNPKIIAFLDLCLSKTKIDPKLLVVEITESSIMEDLSKSKTVISSINARGIKTALDDFGTGYSSMGYLMRYPTNYLKVDREFVIDINTSEASKIMTNNIIKLGHSLGMIVIAEGVETVEELKELKKFGCDIFQGYLFAKPSLKNDFISFVKKIGISDLKSKIM